MSPENPGSKPNNQDENYQPPADDPNPLVNLVQQQQRRQDPRASQTKIARITHHEIKAMKVTTKKESSPLVGLMRSIAGVFHRFMSIFTFDVAGRAKGPSKCELNGCVHPGGTWEGDYPRCSNCGREIKTPEQMQPKRKANPGQQG